MENKKQGSESQTKGHSVVFDNTKGVRTVYEKDSKKKLFSRAKPQKEVFSKGSYNEAKGGKEVKERKDYYDNKLSREVISRTEERKNQVVRKKQRSD